MQGGWKAPGLAGEAPGRRSWCNRAATRTSALVSSTHPESGACTTPCSLGRAIAGDTLSPELLASPSLPGCWCTVVSSWVGTEMAGGSPGVKEDAGSTCCKTPAERGHGTEGGRLTCCSLPLLTTVLSLLILFCPEIVSCHVIVASRWLSVCVPGMALGCPPTL